MVDTKRGFPGPKPNRRRTRAKKTESLPPDDARSDDPGEDDDRPVRSRNENDIEADSVQDESQMTIPGEPLSPEASRGAPGGKERSHSESNHSRDSEGSSTQASSPQGGHQSRPRDEGRPRNRPGDDYSIHVHFDRSQKNFVASVLEIPEVRSVSGNREQSLRDLDRKLEQFIQNAKRKNEAIPEPIQLKRYPDRLEVGISQTLFRKLDLLSRQEKVSLDQLVSELLTAAVERRKEVTHKGNERRPQGHHQQQQQSQSGNQRHGHQQRRGQQSRNYHDTMDNRENFMEYVRNLEKGGGGGWRKK
jgi:predicted HicB family RNase H-like nuclease